MSSSEEDSAHFNSEEEDEYEVPKKRKKKLSKKSFEVPDRPKKRSKKSKSKKFSVKAFIDNEAEVGSEESEEGEDMEIRGPLPDIYQLKSERPNKFLARSEDDLAEEYDRKVMQNLYAESLVKSSSLDQEQRLPSVSDPKLWLVGCRTGKEKEAAINLMQKAKVKEMEGEPLSIFSAFASNHVRDYIYIEAFKMVHVADAIKGITLLNSRKIDLVPIAEMTEVFAMDKVKRPDIKPGSFVRIKSGLYKGDLAQVVYLEDNRNRLVVRLVPRLEKTANKRIRPPAKIFNPIDYRETERKRDQHTGKYYYQWNKLNFYDGFLEKSMSMRMVRTDDVNPTLDEVNTFQVANKDNIDEPVIQVNKQKTIDFVKGDSVRVIKGEVKGITGVVTSCNKDSVFLIPDIRELSDQPQEFSIDEITKIFKAGDHVQVTEGRHSGITGIVVSNKDPSCDILSDISKQIITVFSNSLKITEEVSSGMATSSSYRINDIIVLNNDHSFGLVVKVDADSVQAIMANSDKRTVWNHEIAKRYPPRGSSAIDKMGNTLSVGDMVKITAQSHSKFEKSGSVRNALRGILFLYVPDLHVSENILPVKDKLTTLHGSELHNPVSSTKGIDIVGKTVRLRGGPYRGSTGKVIRCLDRRAVVELVSSNRTLTVDIDMLEDLATSNEPIKSMADLRTPAHSPGFGMGTPAHDMMSPWRDTPRHDHQREWKSPARYG